MTLARLTCLLGALSILPAVAQIPEDISLEPAFGGTFFNFPMGVRHAGDGSGRKFVVERAGRVRIVDAGGNILSTPFLDISSSVNQCSEGGLLGLAFHPDYASNGRFFVHYTFSAQSACVAAQQISRIAEFQVSASDPNQADADSQNLLISIPQDFNNHNGGDLHFGPDGYLYIGMGDGGNGNDPCNRSQTLDPAELLDCGNHPTTPAKALLGKMIRIDIDSVTPAGANQLCGSNSDGSAAYAVPPDNPFIVAIARDRFQSPGQSIAITEGACAETWSYGLRNPYRFSFDRETGDMWLSDVGQNTWEEINLEPAGTPGGRDYGWKICEGSYQRGSATTACPAPDSTLPVLEYRTGQDDNCSVTGGYRYRGPVQSLQGRYIYGDYCSGRIWLASETSPGQWAESEFGLLGGFGNLVGFGEDEAGNLYVTRGSGQILVFAGDED